MKTAYWKKLKILKMKKSKFLYKVIAVLAFIILLAILLMFPPVYNTVSKATGIAATKIRNVATTVASVGIGLMLVAIGAVSFAAAPVVGLVLIGIGLAVTGYFLWRFLPMSSTTTTGIGDAGLQKIMGTN